MQAVLRLGTTHISLEPGKGLARLASIVTNMPSHAILLFSRIDRGRLTEIHCRILADARTAH
ncbi:e142043b-d104-421e-94cb-ce5a0e81be93 [Thermothielavioides terrestris]|uniref:E142043b-d104-421e-94cb-ce5a0e81be93 n=1 Tax=Thermothielavioides terrestris TaxID=2587410 RepID=A0A3S4CAB1_9PEZI|nr:e142043b-d104-421e-94cb-ce5a0e81be93 [Thermothielavioides terrestris]